MNLGCRRVGQEGVGCQSCSGLARQPNMEKDMVTKRWKHRINITKPKRISIYYQWYTTWRHFAIGLYWSPYDRAVGILLGFLSIYIEPDKTWPVVKW